MKWKREEPCTTAYNHSYAEYECPRCGVTFCYSCCGWQNVDQGGKHEPDSMTCPECGKDVLDMEG